ncbi:MAG: hypothetical protein LBM75_11535 [Myxococcales bacterium]|jgi:hypothetical protein|nr:hypothetical protein [Myxococcales bacterium]
MNAPSKIIIAGVIAGILGLLLHVIIENQVEAWVAKTMIGKAIHVQTPPYSISTNILAFVTAILPGIGTAVVFYLIDANLPGKGVFQKGLVFGFLCMLMRGTLIRAPLMDLTVGNPAVVVLAQRLEPFATGFCMALVISAIIEKGKPLPTDGNRS